MDENSRYLLETRNESSQDLSMDLTFRTSQHVCRHIRWKDCLLGIYASPMDIPKSSCEIQDIGLSDSETQDTSLGLSLENESTNTT